MNRLRDGFTLLEVLAVLAVLGLILAALASGVRFGATALQAQARDSSAAEQIGPVDTLLRTLIARASADSGEADARFAGTERSLSFRTEMPRRLAAAERIRDADVTIGVDATHRLSRRGRRGTGTGWFAAGGGTDRAAELGGASRVRLLGSDAEAAAGGLGDGVGGAVGAEAVAGTAGVQQGLGSALAGPHHCDRARPVCVLMPGR